MALTKDQWLKKVVEIFPEWWLENVENQDAHMRGLAELLFQVESDIEDHFRETFIAQAAGEFLDAHGAERSILRTTGELDAQYSVRVRNITNRSNCPALKVLVDGFLIVGESQIFEDYNASLFMNRENFMNRGEVLINSIVNVFTIVVDKQLHDPYSFMDREYFLDRGDFMGSSESSEYVFQLIVEAVNQNKAEGTKYRVVERLAL